MTKPRAPAASGCLAILLTLGGLPVVFFGSCRLALGLLERPVVSSAYGSDAYAAGLRIVGRQGQLSDGRRLSSGCMVALGAGSFLLSSPVWVGYVVMLKAFGLFLKR